MNKIYINLGLPKTSTGNLQKNLYPKLKEFNYIGRFRGNRKRLMRDAPARFHHADRPARLVGALQSAETEDRAVRLALYAPEGVPVLALVGEQPVLRAFAFGSIRHPAEPAHDIFGIGAFPEKRPVFIAPVAQDQALRLVAEISH